MHRLFRDLAADVGIEAEGDRLFEVALRAPGTPADTAHRPIQVADHLRRAAKRCGQRCGQGAGSGRRSDAAVPGDILLAEAALCDPAEALRQLCVVAEPGMGIERQVIGEEVDVVGEQGADAATAETGDATILAFPEPAVMNEDRISAACNRGFEQRLAGGDAGDDAADLGASFHLQTVWAIIPEARRF